MSGVIVRTRRGEPVLAKHPKGDVTKDYLTLTLGTVAVQISNEQAMALVHAIIGAVYETHVAHEAQLAREAKLEQFPGVDANLETWPDW